MFPAVREYMYFACSTSCGDGRRSHNSSGHAPPSMTSPASPCASNRRHGRARAERSSVRSVRGCRSSSPDSCGATGCSRLWFRVSPVHKCSRAAGLGHRTVIHPDCPSRLPDPRSTTSSGYRPADQIGAASRRAASTRSSVRFDPPAALVDRADVDARRRSQRTQGLEPALRLERVACDGSKEEQIEGGPILNHVDRHRPAGDRQMRFARDEAVASDHDVADVWVPCVIVKAPSASVVNVCPPTVTVAPAIAGPVTVPTTRP